MPGQAPIARNLTLRTHLGADRHPTLALPTLYFALFRNDPSGAGVEPTSTGGYARVAKANDATLWGTILSTDLAGQNKGASGEIAWPAATGVYSITDPLTHWAAFDNSAGGTLWYWNELTSPITVTGVGDQPRIPLNTLILNVPT